MIHDLILTFIFHALSIAHEFWSCWSYTDSYCRILFSHIKDVPQSFLRHLIMANTSVAIYRWNYTIISVFHFKWHFQLCSDRLVGHTKQQWLGHQIYVVDWCAFVFFLHSLMNIIIIWWHILGFIYDLTEIRWKWILVFPWLSTETKISPYGGCCHELYCTSGNYGCHLMIPILADAPLES